MGSFLSFYDNVFYKILICPQGITYNPCLEGSRGVFILKDLVSRTFNYVNKMAISKFSFEVFGEKVGVRGGLVSLHSLSTIKKGTSPLNFQSNERFLKFLRHRLL